MSFVDEIEKGLGSGGRSSPSGWVGSGQHDSKAQQMRRAVVRQLTQLSGAVEEVAVTVDCIGTASDTVESRRELERRRKEVNVMVQTVRGEMSALNDLAVSQSEQAAHHMAVEKLKLDFRSVCERWKDVLSLSLQRERVCVAKAKKASVRPGGGGGAGGVRGAGTDPVLMQELDTQREAEERQRLLQQERRAEQVKLEEELIVNESIIQEREDAMRMVEQNINDLNEMFMDLGTLVKNQGVVIDNIESNVESAAYSTEKAAGELVKAQKHQKRVRGSLCILILVIAVVVTVVCVLVVVLLSIIMGVLGGLKLGPFSTAYALL